MPSHSPKDKYQNSHSTAPLAGTFLSWLCLLIAIGLPFGSVRAQEPAGQASKDEFSSLVKMAPFVVNGQPLSISVYARSRSDRRYGEQFSEEVFKVVYETVTESTGRGLVVVGAKGEPHPIFVFRKFLALARDGKLDPAVAARGPELSGMMERWRHTLDEDKASDSGDDEAVDLEYDKIVTALPLPLEGVGAKLYQLAWEEGFDDAKVEERLRTLKAGDLERRDLFKHYDWAFYLPPKGAFNKVLDELIAEALKQEDVGFFSRLAVKGVLLAVKPKIRRAIEAVRQGLLFMTMVEARTAFSEEIVSKLTGTYIEACMPGEDADGLSGHARAVKAVRGRLGELASGEKRQHEEEGCESNG